MGYFTMYNPVGATVTNAEFVNSAYSNISASSPTAMEDGWGARGARIFTNWTATTGNGSIAVLNGDTGIFYSTDPRTRVFNSSQRCRAPGCGIEVRIKGGATHAKIR